jgi:hypothetical protein
MLPIFGLRSSDATKLFDADVQIDERSAGARDRIPNRRGAFREEV